VQAESVVDAKLSCVAGLWQAQPGFWYRFYKETSGTMQLGLSYPYDSQVHLGGNGSRAHGSRKHRN